jgi:hypothetical protein
LLSHGGAANVRTCLRPSGHCGATLGRRRRHAVQLLHAMRHDNTSVISTCAGRAHCRRQPPAWRSLPQPSRARPRLRAIEQKVVRRRVGSHAGGERGKDLGRAARRLGKKRRFHAGGAARFRSLGREGMDGGRSGAEPRRRRGRRRTIWEVEGRVASGVVGRRRGSCGTTPAPWKKAVVEGA